MILVADSGSTKTTWALVESGNKIVTEGLNPHFSTDKQVLDVCATVRQHLENLNSKSKIFFYGAGCGNKQQAARMKALLQQGFNSDNVTIETDMLGACRAVAGNRFSLVGILGTGSNSCYYDGTSITCSSPSLGYILGDEGSANHLGRLLLKTYLNGDLPDELSLSFRESYPYNHDQWIEHIYRQPNANRFLASLAPFAIEHLDHKLCENLVRSVLDEWYSVQLCKIINKSNCHSISIVGGFAKGVETLLRTVMDSHGLTVDNVVANPIEPLVKYHIS